jgi:6-phosphogluconolactonase
VSDTVRERSTLVVVVDDVALARAVADRFAEEAARAVGARGRFAVALAGGSTPKAAYALLAEEPFRSHVPWNGVRFFFSDERCVGPDDPESNFGMARDAMLAPLRIEAKHIYRMRGEDPPAQAAAAYAALLTEQLGPSAVFDLIMLGMGPDGHTASLFPGSAPHDGGSELVAAPFVPKFNTYRLTFTPRTINAARAVQIATAGTAKAAALAGALDGPYDPNLYPVQIVQPHNGELTWLVDRAAAAQLQPAIERPTAG